MRLFFFFSGWVGGGELVCQGGEGATLGAAPVGGAACLRSRGAEGSRTVLLRTEEKNKNRFFFLVFFFCSFSDFQFLVGTKKKTHFCKTYVDSLSFFEPSFLSRCLCFFFFY